MGYWSNSSSDLNKLFRYEVDYPPPKRCISSPSQRPRRHVGFKDEVEETRKYTREASRVQPNTGGFQGHQENVDKEADDFIKYEHNKFQWSRTMSAYPAK